MNKRIVRLLTVFLIAVLLSPALAKNKKDDNTPKGPITISPPINAVPKGHLTDAPLPEGMDWDPVKAVATIKSEGDGKWPADMDLGAPAKAGRGKKKKPSGPPPATLNGYRSITEGVDGKIKASCDHFPREGHDNAFDNSDAKWCAKDKTPTLEYEFPDGKNKPIIAYAIKSANDSPGRDPKEFCLSGSNDGKTWEIIDQQKNVKFPDRYYTKVFKLNKPVNYKAYQFKVLANGGDDSFQIAELYLLEKGKMTPPPEPSKPLGKDDVEKLLKLADDPSGYEPMIKPDLSNVQMRPNAWSFNGDELSPKPKQKDIWTREKYGDFIIDLEVRCDAKDTNSGIFLRCPNINQWLHTAIEVQINKKPEGNKRHISGAIYDVKAPTKDMIKAVGEWNHYTVIAKGSHILVRINGELVNQINLDEWTTAGRNPDGSRNKFKYAYAKMSRVGYIGLQEHGKPVTFRNVRIKKL